MRTWPLLLLPAALLAGLAGCDGEVRGSSAASGTPPAPPAVVRDAEGHPLGLPEYRKWSERVGQGAQPQGDVAFANLKALGYATVLSVDGSVPDVEAAARHGLRYVHVPIGYDGVTREAALQIVKAARLSPQPIYVHCHHGRHRGPAAAMVCRLSEDGISHEEAVHGLETSGTSPKYTGLWRDVREFVVPSAEELATVGDDLPSRVLPSGVQAGMVDVNLRWDNLQRAQQAGWKAMADHPDVSPPHEARMLWELLREMARNEPEAKQYGEAFLRHLTESEQAIVEMEKAIRAGDGATADRHFAVARELCATCHREFRD